MPDQRQGMENETNPRAHQRRQQWRAHGV